jgi:hypothetical protein
MDMTIDAFLSRTASQMWPNSLVVLLRREDAIETWILKRPGQTDVGLGDRFPAARNALDALIAYERTTKGELHEKKHDQDNAPRGVHQGPGPATRAEV